MQEWPAIITFVHSDTLVDLTVFRSKGALLFECITSEELVGTHDSPSSHSWHWPCDELPPQAVQLRRTDGVLETRAHWLRGADQPGGVAGRQGRWDPGWQRLRRPARRHVSHRHSQRA